MLIFLNYIYLGIFFSMYSLWGGPAPSPPFYPLKS